MDDHNCKYFKSLVLFLPHAWRQTKGFFVVRRRTLLKFGFGGVKFNSTCDLQLRKKIIIKIAVTSTTNNLSIFFSFY